MEDKVRVKSEIGRKSESKSEIGRKNKSEIVSKSKSEIARLIRQCACYLYFPEVSIRTV